MSDFHQTGMIATLHRLNGENLGELEEKLSQISETRGITLVLPSLYSELLRSALKNIVKELQHVRYLREIVVSLGPATQDEFE